MEPLRLPKRAWSERQNRVGQGPWRGATLTLPPEAEAPLSGGDTAVLVGVAGVEERADADLVFVQVDGSQLCLVQEEVGTGVQLGEHPADRVLAAGPQALVQAWGEGQGSHMLKVSTPSLCPSIPPPSHQPQPSVQGQGSSDSKQRGEKLKNGQRSIRLLLPRTAPQPFKTLFESPSGKTILYLSLATQLSV